MSCELCYTLWPFALRNTEKTFYMGPVVDYCPPKSFWIWSCRQLSQKKNTILVMVPLNVVTLVKEWAKLELLMFFDRKVFFHIYIWSKNLTFWSDLIIKNSGRFKKPQFVYPLLIIPMSHFQMPTPTTSSYFRDFAKKISFLTLLINVTF
jgi:hypothetical protein